MSKIGTMLSGLLLSIVVLSVLGPMASNADTEPNDDFLSAEDITAGDHTGTLTDPADPSDFYLVDIVPGQEINVSITCNSNELSAYIYDEDMYWLSQEDGSDSGTRYMSYQTSYETTLTSIYLKFETNAGDISYSFTLVLNPPNDGGSGGDAPGTWADALTVTEGTIEGRVNAGTGNDNNDGEDGYDCFKFWAGAGDRFNVSFTATSTSDPVYLNLIDPEEDYIFQDIGTKHGVTKQDEWWTANETEMGWYIIEVYQDLEPGGYSIVLDIVRQDDAGSGEDAPAAPGSGILSMPGTINGHLEDEDSVDCYRVYMGWGEVINIGFRGFSEGDNLYIELLDVEGSTLVSNKSSISDSGISFSYYTANETSLRFYCMRVWSDTRPGGYVITFGVERQNDAGMNMDVPGTIATKSVLGIGSFEGWIFDLDTVDMYILRLVSGDVLDMTFGISYGMEATIELLNASLYTIASHTVTFGKFARIRYCLDSITDNETAYVKITSGTVRYSLGIAVSGQNDANLGGDAGGVTEMGIPSFSPYPIQAGTYLGYLYPNDQTDSYSIQVPENNELNISVVPEPTLSVGGILFNSTKAPISSEVGLTPGTEIVLKMEFTEADSVQLVIGSYGTWGNYTLSVVLAEIAPSQDKPSAPVLSAVPGSGKVTLTWTEPTSDGGSPITGYKLYRKTAGSLTPATLLTTLGPLVLLYEDKFVISGTTYEYTVVAENANGEGAPSATVTASPLPPAADSDLDGMPDDWEERFGLNKSDPSDANLDKDGDGHTNLAENDAGSDPTDPLSTPLDLDADGMPNTWEVSYELDPTDAEDADDDPDGDGRDNLKEFQDNTNPKLYDTSGVGDDDDDDDDVSSWLPWVCCIVGPLGLIGLIVLILVIVLLIVKGRKKKDDDEKKEE